MNTSAKRDADACADLLSTFSIQVCSKNGQLLSEYRLTRRDHNVGTLSAAERFARENLAEYRGEPLIIVVSEETLTKLRQVQLKVIAKGPRSS